MKFTFFLATFAIIGIATATPFGLEQRDDPSFAEAAHACDGCRAKYDNCMKSFCWNPPGNKKAHDYCNKMCSCKTYKSGGLCIGCQWACH